MKKIPTIKSIWSMTCLLGAYLLLSNLTACGLWVGNPKPKDDEQPQPTPTKLVSLPLIAPPVKAATPAGFIGANGLHLTLPTDEFKNRFFATGPTSIFEILNRIDARIAGINTRSKEGDYDCLNQVPTEYTLSPFGQAVTFYAQCYEQMDPDSPQDSKLVQFGQHEGKTYLYYAVGQERAAVIATPQEGSDDSFQIQAWIGVGYLNSDSCGSFEKCSYGVIQLNANSSSRSFEMAVAGLGFGYCGAQLKSNSERVYAIGSTDGPSCQAPDTLCVAAADLTQTDACTDLTAFELPALGRTAVSGGASYDASRYPDAPSIILNGESDDSLHFGPTIPTEGVGKFDLKE